MRPARPRPRWLVVRVASGENYRRSSRLVTALRLHAVCESAACPYVSDRWTRGSVTFMIFGNVCPDNDPRIPERVSGCNSQLDQRRGAEAVGRVSRNMNRARYSLLECG
ncbi:MAG: hypothetical protein OXN97_22040 [Bryobacterales bacterium]|nr:hypothetical protein [Bryobacterales bacterium]MDE0625995.1 hypothetical protein [Bryobacterales bacterium]